MAELETQDLVQILQSQSEEIVDDILPKLDADGRDVTLEI